MSLCNVEHQHGRLHQSLTLHMLGVGSGMLTHLLAYRTGSWLTKAILRFSQRSW